jgi:hypothetical protein
MMPDSTNNRVVLFDPINGALVNSNYFGLAAGTPIHAMQVGNEIWVSEQIGTDLALEPDGTRWARSPARSTTFAAWSRSGARLSGHHGTANGAPGRAVARFDTAGNPSGPSPRR